MFRETRESFELRDGELEFEEKQSFTKGNFPGTTPTTY